MDVVGELAARCSPTLILSCRSLDRTALSSLSSPQIVSEVDEPSRAVHRAAAVLRTTPGTPRTHLGTTSNLLIPRFDISLSTESTDGVVADRCSQAVLVLPAPRPLSPANMTDDSDTFSLVSLTSTLMSDLVRTAENGPSDLTSYRVHFGAHLLREQAKPSLPSSSRSRPSRRSLASSTWPVVLRARLFEARSPAPLCYCLSKISRHQRLRRRRHRRPTILHARTRRRAGPLLGRPGLRSA